MQVGVGVAIRAACSVTAVREPCRGRGQPGEAGLGTLGLACPLCPS